MDMIEKRNLSSHTYNLVIAVALVSAIIEIYHPAFLVLQEEMQRRN